MRYIMVTHWDNHWDSLPNDQTSYSFYMFRKGLTLDKITEHTPTIFIKLDRDTRIPQYAWEGCVHRFKVDESAQKVYFRVRIDERIEIPEYYSQYKEGWYLEELEVRDKIQETEFWDPPLISTLISTDKWNEFEDITFYLLKLTGIHDIYKYENQKGQADGFFRLRNFAVMYDCTLDKNFEISKEQQIKNYCAQLREGSVVCGPSIKDVSNCQKNVWIITRKACRKIKEIDNVTIKEVNIDAIIRLYRKRLIDNLNEDELENELRNVC